MLLKNIKSGLKIFLKNRSNEKLIKDLRRVTKYIWNLDHLSSWNARQQKERDKFFNQKNAMLTEMKLRGIEN